MPTAASIDRLFETAPDTTRSLRANREPLVSGPTPLQPLDRLREALGGGPRLWVKRDDLTGFAAGGNKSRKLEYLVAQARAEDADVLVTVGAAQSNHARQTAAAAARAGLDAVLVLRYASADPDGIPYPGEQLESGNVLLDRVFGAELIWVEQTADDPHPERALAEQTVERLRSEGRRPFLIPGGGSTPVGSLGYLESYAEIIASGVDFREIVVASGSGGTQAGLIAGRHLLPHAGDRPDIRGVAVGPESEDFDSGISALAEQTVQLLDPDAAEVDPAVLDREYAGRAYGEPTPEALEAIRLFARAEGLLLDPVYTAKAAAALIGGVRRGRYPSDADLLFLHTGGTPALYAHATSLTSALTGR